MICLFAESNIFSNLILEVFGEKIRLSSYILVFIQEKSLLKFVFNFEFIFLSFVKIKKSLF
jgi:hypothetical protein